MKTAFYNGQISALIIRKSGLHCIRFAKTYFHEKFPTTFGISYPNQNFPEKSILVQNIVPQWAA